MRGHGAGPKGKSTPATSLTELREAKDLAQRVAEKWGTPDAARNPGFVKAVARLLSRSRKQFEEAAKAKARRPKRGK